MLPKKFIQKNIDHNKYLLTFVSFFREKMLILQWFIKISKFNI